MPTQVQATALDRAMERRSDVHTALHELGSALAAPAPGREDAWRGDLERAVDAMRSAFSGHVEETEGPDGLLAQIQADAPRLTNSIVQAQEEHVSLRTALDHALMIVEDPLLTPNDVRDELMHLCSRLARHCQRGSDLVYEAYSVDVGTGAD